MAKVYLVIFCTVYCSLLFGVSARQHVYVGPNQEYKTINSAIQNLSDGSELSNIYIV